MTSVTADITLEACIERELSSIKRSLVSRTHLLQDPEFTQTLTDQLNMALARLEPGNEEIPNEDTECRHADCVREVINEIWPNVNRLLKEEQAVLVSSLIYHLTTTFPPRNGHCSAAYPFN